MKDRKYSKHIKQMLENKDNKLLELIDDLLLSLSINRCKHPKGSILADCWLNNHELIKDGNDILIVTKCL